jgi:NitT/TauT family transport system substrate-binding protein
MRQSGRSRRPGVVLGALVLVTSLATGCGGSDESTTGGAGLEKDTITVVTLPVVTCAPIYIAQKQKLFEAEGLKVNIKLISQSTASIPALVKGQVDLTCGNYVSFLQAHEKGTLKLSIVAEAANMASNYESVMVKADSPIKTAKDLEGKKVATNLLNNMQSLLLDVVLRANNVDPAKVKDVVVPFPQMGAALEKGQVDAINTLEPFISDVQKKLGARSVLDVGGEPVSDMPIAGYLGTQDFVTKNPKTAAAFQRALIKAQQAAVADRKQVEQVLPQFAGVDAQVASVIKLPGWPTSLNTTRIQRVVDLMVAGGLLKQKPDLKTVLFQPAA